MPPIPVFLLFLRRQFSKITIGITVILICPAVVVDHFVVIPNMVVAIVGVIDAVVLLGAACQREKRYCGCQAE
jgi:hypothetical protein